MVAEELPRITRALRAHTQLDKPRCLKPTLDSTKQNLVKSRSLQKFKSFIDIQNYIKQNELNQNDLLNLLQQLKEACKLLTGDQTDEMIEDAAIFTLKMFLDQDIVMLKHLSQLRQMFGTVQASTANKVCEVVTKISNEINEDTKSYIKQEAGEEKAVKKLWGENIECHYIPYKPVKKPLAKLIKKPASASAFVNDFSMKYNILNSSINDKNDVKSAKPVPESKYGKSWLETKMKELYENSTGVSSIDILQSLITLINSPKSNEELQNDMFELLGFDKFEFIQELLEHRNEVVSTLKTPQQPTLSELTAMLPENKMPQYLCQVSVQSEQDKLLVKLARKEEKRAKNNRKNEDEEEQEINISQLRAKR